MLASGDRRRRVYLVALVGITIALAAMLLGVARPDRADAASAEEICLTETPVYWLVFLETGEIRSTTPPGDGAITYSIDEDGFHWTNNSSMDVYRIAERWNGPDDNIVWDRPNLPNPVPLDQPTVAVKMCFDDGTLSTTTTTAETTTTTSGETTTTTAATTSSTSSTTTTTQPTTTTSILSSTITTSSTTPPTTSGGGSSTTSETLPVTGANVEDVALVGGALTLLGLLLLTGTALRRRDDG